MLYCPLTSHESGLQELTDNSIVLEDEQEALLAKLDTEHQKALNV